MRRIGLTVTVAVVATSAALSGCERGDDEESSRARPDGAVARKAPVRSGKAPTKPDFLRKADALCADAKRRGAPISRSIKAKIANEDAAGVAADLRKGLPIADALLAGLRALTPPKGDEAVVGDYVDIVAQQRRRVPPLIDALEAEDISTIEVLAGELRNGNRRAERLARGYGFIKCRPEGLPTR